jgi:signal transduction histidine kinase/ligand-binding sensor domain-containing protein
MRIFSKNTRTMMVTWMIIFHFSFIPAFSIKIKLEQKTEENKNLRFVQILYEEGLSQSAVYCILQNKKGFMWFGTQEGLNRFDGYEFKVFKHIPNDNTSLSDNYILCMHEDKEGNLWIGTNAGGLNKLESRTGRFTTYTHTPNNKNSLSNNTVQTIWVDQKGIVWIGTRDGGIDKFHPRINRFVNYNIILKSPQGISVNVIFEDGPGNLLIGTKTGLIELKSDRISTWHQSQSNDPNNSNPSDVRAIFKDQAGDIWIGTSGGGLNKFNRENKTFIPCKPPKNLSFDNVYAISEECPGELWLGTEKGLYKFYTKNNNFYHYEIDPSNPGKKDIRSIYKDEGGVLWVGTYGVGVYKHDHKTRLFTHYKHNPSDSNSLSDNIVWSIYEDENRILWVGTYTGGLNKIDRKMEQIKCYKHKDKDTFSLSHDDVRAIIEDDNGNLWIGTREGLCKFNNERFYTYHLPGDIVLQKKNRNDIQIIIKSGDEKLWIGTQGGLFKFNPSLEKPIDFLDFKGIRTLFEDSKRILWIGTEYNGLYSLYTNSREQKQYTHEPNNNQSLSHNSIRCIYEDSSGVLWVGTYGGGLNKLIDKEKKSFRSYQEKDGLPGSSIYGILEDNKKRLWISTNRGISRFNPGTGYFKNYDVEDGLQSSEFNTGAFFKSKPGEMFFGGINGLTTFFPGKIEVDWYKPPIVITNFLLSNEPAELQRKDPKSPLKQPIYETGSLTLSHRQNFFSFEFSSLHYANPKKNKYKYKLEDWDKDWLETDAKNRRATYTNLPAGDYKFMVNGSNRDGIWSNQIASIDIKIKPPFWKTWWAYLIYLLGIAAIGYVSWSAWKERKVIERQKIIDKLKDEFLSKTSHELRTPLQGIIGVSESLLKGAAGALNQKIIDNLNIIADTGKRLSHLVNDLLDFARLKNTNIILKKERVDMHSLTDVIFTLCSHSANNKGLQLINKVDAGTPSVNGDKDRLMQVMYNLVDNAIKFTESGNITVSAEVGKSNMLYMRVSDTGIGIPGKKFKTIFDSFETLERAEDRTHGGTGLGLSITKQLVELQDGKIWVDSTEGKGSTFTFTLPVTEKQKSKKLKPLKLSHLKFFKPVVSQANLPTTKISPIAAEKKDFRILVVDDDLVLLPMLCNQLALAGYSVSEAVDGPGALEVMEGEQRIDLILLDIMLPRMSGFEVCRKIRETHPAHDLPIIFITAKNLELDIISGLEAGANDFITKPITGGELLARIQTHLQLLEINRSLEKQVDDRTREIKNMEAHLIQTEKMSSLGQLVSGVAHEINNPTAFMNTAAYNLKKNLEEFKNFLFQLAGEDTEKEIITAIDQRVASLVDSLKTLDDGTQRICKIVMDLRTFYRKESKEKKSFQLHEGLQATINLAKPNYSDKINFNIDLQGDPVIEGYRDELNQVFMNLIVNGCQAITSKQKEEKRETKEINDILTICTGIKGKYVLIGFQDTGIGMTEEVKKKMFEPFFTTRPAGEGTGLGLSLSRDIIKKHDGRIECETELGMGTTIDVYLPLPGNEEEISETEGR